MCLLLLCYGMACDGMLGFVVLSCYVMCCGCVLACSLCVVMCWFVVDVLWYCVFVLLRLVSCLLCVACVCGFELVRFDVDAVLCLCWCVLFWCVVLCCFAVCVVMFTY